MINPKDEFPIRVIFKSPKKVGMWQMQTFDEEMTPFWDDQYDMLKDAILDQLKRGFKIKTVD